ncbi:hypothetical protein, partial [Listeria monocytogenes]
ILEKYVPIGFSFNLTNYGFKVKSVTFDEFVFPKNSNFHLYVSSGIYDESSKVYIDEKDGRVHLISHTK